MISEHRDALRSFPPDRGRSLRDYSLPRLLLVASIIAPCDPQKDAERNSTSRQVTQRVRPPDPVETKGGCHSIMVDIPMLIWRVWQPTDGNLAEPACRAEGRRGAA